MKKSGAALILMALTFAATSVLSQEPQDRTAAVRTTLLQLIKFSDKQVLQSSLTRTLLAGEALEWQMLSFGKLAAAPDKIVLIDDNTAVGRIQWFGEGNYVSDLYFYLTLQTSWKVTAVRRLALTGIIEGAYRHLKSKSSLTSEEQEQVGNYELLLASDDFLRRWFAKNAAGMNKLYEMSRGLKSGYFHEQNDPKYAEIKSQLKSLHLGGIEVGTDGNVEFIIGGVTDNTVGFLYSPTNQPPRISFDSYIWVEEIAPRWFIFRTT